MTEAQSRNLKLAYFVLGISVPIAAFAFWPKIACLWSCSKKEQVDRAHDITVEDSFPASDPPSAW